MIDLDALILEDLLSKWFRKAPALDRLYLMCLLNNGAEDVQYIQLWHSALIGKHISKDTVWRQLRNMRARLKDYLQQEHE